MLFALMIGCMPKYSGPSAPLELAHWTASAEATPTDHLRPPATHSRMFRYQSATPTAPADLYDRIDASAVEVERLERAMWVCRISRLDTEPGLSPEPDMRVTLTIGDRISTFVWENQSDWPFTLGLVDLRAGEIVSLEVTDDRLGTDAVLLEQSARFDGRVPLRWTERTPGHARTNMNCKVLTKSERDLLTEARLSATWKAIAKAHALRGDISHARAALQGLAAIVGWSDPRVRYLLRELGEPADSGGSGAAHVSSGP